MSLRINNNSYIYEANTINQSVLPNVNSGRETAENQGVSSNLKPKLPSIPSDVTFTALGCDTEEKLARAAYMAAAAKAGISDVSAQRKFADQMLAENPPDLRLTNGNVELDDAKVKHRLFNQSVNFTLSQSTKADLREFRDQYIAGGGKVRSNSNPTVDLRQPPAVDGTTNSPTSPITTKFRVLLNSSGNPTNGTRILAKFAEDQYKSSNLWGQNYLQIAELSAGQGVKPKITNVSRIGNQVAVEFELSPLDRAKIHENYKVVQQEVNRAVAAYENFANNNEISSFLRGVFNGAIKSVKGTIDLVLDLPGTMKALWQVVSNPGETFNALKNELSESWEEFKAAPPSRKSEMLGELVGQAVVEILIGKGIGRAGGILAKTKTGAKLLEDASQLKQAGLVKIADAFSDEAAVLAKRRFAQKMSTQLYSGIPVDALADLTVIATNKVQKGVVKFADFSRQMIQEFGENVRPHLEKMYRGAMEKIGRKIDEAEINNTDVNQIARRQTITPATLENVVVPGVRGGEFASWFNSLTKGEMDALWTSSALRKTVEDRLRHPGGFHEWLPVSRAPKFREWGVKAEQIWDLRTKTNEVRFMNPAGVHGGLGSATAHRELFRIIDESSSFADFKLRLQEWASRRLEGGVDSLPEGFK